jgi:hypothetical protein
LKGRINTLPPLPNPKEKPAGLKRRACNLHHRRARGPEVPPIACRPAIVCSRAESDMSLPAMIHTRGKGRGFTPPRPTPDQQKTRYLNLAGVPPIEHPCPKMESGKLRGSSPSTTKRP